MLESAIGGQATMAHPAAVTLTRGALGTLLATVTERIPDAAILEEFPPLFWRATISNNRLDAYWTRMHESSLRNYADEAAAGVPFQDSHMVYGMERRLGYSLSGAYAGPGGNGIAHVDADFYTLSGLSAEIDAFTLALRGGLQRDVSIGFFGGMFRCSICGLDMLRDYNCPHIPGRRYVKRDSQGRETDESEIAIAWIEDAHLSEVSAVYHGATPGASVLKLYRQLEAGDPAVTLAEVAEAERHYGVRFRAPQWPGVTVIDPGAGPASVARQVAGREESSAMSTPASGSATAPIVSAETTPETPAATPDLVGAIRAAVTRAGLPDGSGLEDLVSEIQRLRPLADDGRAYRADLVTDALAAGVRALGAAFKPETYRAMLEAAPVATVRQMRDDWEAVAAGRLIGGRATADQPAEAPVADPAVDMRPFIQA